jgi:hypothetical protein
MAGGLGVRAGADIARRMDPHPACSSLDGETL